LRHQNTIDRHDTSKPSSTTKDQQPLNCDSTTLDPGGRRIRPGCRLNPVPTVMTIGPHRLRLARSTATPSHENQTHQRRPPHRPTRSGARASFAEAPNTPPRPACREQHGQKIEAPAQEVAVEVGTRSPVGSANGKKLPRRKDSAYRLIPRKNPPPPPPSQSCERRNAAWVFPDSDRSRRSDSRHTPAGQQ